MSPLRAVSLLAVATVVGVGLVGTPRLLEPGRSERAGIDLAPTLTGAGGGSPADWTHDASHATARAKDGFLTVHSTARGLQIVSRPLALVPNRCYVARLRLAATHPLKLALLTGTADAVLSRNAVPPSRMASRSFTFTAVEHRMTLALIAPRRGTTTVLGLTTIRPRACPDALSPVLGG